MDNILIQLLIQIPLGAIVIFFILRTLRHRDNFETAIYDQMTKMLEVINTLKTQQAVQAKDVEAASRLVDLVVTLSASVEKAQRDLDNYFTRLREVESYVRHS